MSTTAERTTIHLIRETYGPIPNDAHSKLAATLIDMGDGAVRRVSGAQQAHVHTVGRQWLILVPHEPIATIVPKDGEEDSGENQVTEPFAAGGKYEELLADRWHAVSEDKAREFISHLV